MKTSHPDVKILGGAALAIPVGYLKSLFDLGALNYMDGLVIHPYTTDPEQFEKQRAVLRAAMGSTPRPIHVTEKRLGHGDRRYCRTDWYALRQQQLPSNIWYKNVALASFSNQLLPPGQAYKLMTHQVLSKGAGSRIAINDFTYAYAFGSNAMVIWSEPRSLTVTANAKFYNPQGAQINQPASISAHAPIVIVSDTPLAYGSNVQLGATQLVADSYAQFVYSKDVSGTPQLTGPWSFYSYGVHDQRFDLMSTQGGGEIRGSGWTP